VSLSSEVTFGKPLGQGLTWTSFLHVACLTTARQTSLINLLRPCGALDRPRLLYSHLEARTVRQVFSLLTLVVKWFRRNLLPCGSQINYVAPWFLELILDLARTSSRFKVSR
jgi:hypothetical protein